jgi:hypothetical protein
LEKKNKGQVEALAHIEIDYHHKCDATALRDATPGIEQVKVPKFNGPFIRKRDPNSKYGTPYKMALYLCEQIRDRELADSNEDYTLWVMLPPIGMIHDENELTIEEAQECFMEAICGGDRYGSPGRGAGYFMRQWKSHRPEIRRHGTRSLGSIIYFCQQIGIEIPWIPKTELYDPAKHDPTWNAPCRLAIPEDVVQSYFRKRTRRKIAG